MSGTHIAAAVLLLLVAILQLSIRRVMSTNQEKLNVITTQLGAISGQITKGLGEVTAKIDALKNQAPESLDFTGLERTVDQLKIAGEALDGIVPDEVEAEDPAAETPAETPAVVTPPTEEVQPPATEAPVVDGTLGASVEVPSTSGTESTDTASETPTETEGASSRTTSSRKK